MLNISFFACVYLPSSHQARVSIDHIRKTLFVILYTEGKISKVQLVVPRKTDDWFEYSQGKIFVVQWCLWPKDLGKSMINVFFSEHG